MTVAGPAGYILARYSSSAGEGAAPPTATSTQRAPQTDKSHDAFYSPLEEWKDLSTWTAKNLRAQVTGEQAPSGAKATSLVEDDQNIWRNVQVVVARAVRDRRTRVTAEIKLASPKREAVLMVLANLDRFACNLRVDGTTSTIARGAATVGTCSTTALADRWWKLDLTGELPMTAARDPVFAAVALTQQGFQEDYQGDGQSGILVGEVTFAQLKAEM